MTEVIINISNRRLVNVQELKDAFKNLKDGKHLVTVKDFRRRTLPANAYYWGVMVPMVRKALFEQGFDDVLTNEDAHEIIKAIHLSKRMFSKQTGHTIDIVGHTKTLSITEFSDFIERVCKWAAEYLGIHIPSPNEQMVEFAEYNEKLHESMVEE